MNPVCHSQKLICSSANHRVENTFKNPEKKSRLILDMIHKYIYIHKLSIHTLYIHTNVCVYIYKEYKKRTEYQYLGREKSKLNKLPKQKWTAEY